jgi:NAD(P)-dependent dehydrogenase (short-subunit alcohol dehydrogenase family)
MPNIPVIDLTGKVVLVTGAGSGIGRASAVRYAQAGASVMCADINADGAKFTAETVRKDGGVAASLRLDVTDESAVEKSLQQTIDALGGLDIIFNNAGIDDDYRKTLDVNQHGVYYGLKHGSAALAARGGGAIVNTASIAGLVGVVNPISRRTGVVDMAEEGGIIAYIASKHAVVGMTKQYAIDFAARGVRVNAVAPGYIETPMIEEIREEMQIQLEYEQLYPMARLGQPDEIATAVVFLSSEAASFITGHILPVDGGYTCR